MRVTDCNLDSIFTKFVNVQLIVRERASSSILHIGSIVSVEFAIRVLTKVPNFIRWSPKLVHNVAHDLRRYG